MKKIGIYKITNPKGAVYIGESKDIDRRWNYDYKNLRCKSQTKLYNSFIKYGLENHTFEIVKECTIEEIPYYERHYQEFYNVLDRKLGLNLKYRSTIEKKEQWADSSKIKASNSQKKRFSSGEVPALKGKKHSEESIKRISNSVRKYYDNSENRIKASNSQKKRFENPEQRKKCSRGLGILNPFFGKELDANHREKISISKKGKMFSASHKKNLSKKSAMAKTVINIINGFFYNSAKEAWESQEQIKSYGSFRQALSGNWVANIPFEYI